MDSARASKRMRAAAAAAAAAAAGWSDLTTEIGGDILSRAPSLADRACFRSVCRQWRLAAQQQWRLLPPALPWLATADLGTFVSLPDGACHNFSLNTTAHSWEAFDEWLVMFHDGEEEEEEEAHLLLTKPLLLPDVDVATTTTTMKLPYASKESLHKMVMCPGGFVAAFIKGVVAFCRPGARSWSEQPRPPGLCLVDIALHRGTLYALYGRGTLCAYDLSSSDDDDEPIKVTARVLPLPTQCGLDHWQKPSGESMSPLELLVYLVSASGGKKLLMVRRLQLNCNFKLLEADLDGRRWSEVASLDADEVLFVSSKCSRALQLSPGGGGASIRGNRIVYTDENRLFRWPARMMHGGKYEVDDIGYFGVHDLATKRWYVHTIAPRGSFRTCTPTGYFLFFPSSSSP